MPALTAIVLEQALSQCAAWHAAGRPMTVSVNVSVTNLLDPEFINSVTAALARHHLPASSLMLEVTETTIIRDFDVCKLVIAQLRAPAARRVHRRLRRRVHLARVPRQSRGQRAQARSHLPHRTGHRRQERNLALVRATIALGHKLGMRVVAEGIEESAALDLLASVGCDLAQGYFISRPMLAKDLVLPAQWTLVAESETAAAG